MNTELKNEAIKNAYIELAEILKERGKSGEEVAEIINKYSGEVKGFDKDFKLGKVESQRIIDAIARTYGDTEREEWWYNLYGIPLNDRMKKFQLFMSYGEWFFNKEEKKIEGVFEDIRKSVNDIKYFQISETLGNVLLNTKSEKTDKYTFENFFIDGKFKIKKEEYVGVLVFNMEVFDESEEKIEKAFEILKIPKTDKIFKSCLIMKKVYRKDGLAYGFEFFDMGGEKNKEIQNMIYSFCNFLNEREVEIKELPFNPKNNERRKSKGRCMLPRENVVRIYGNLKKYIDKTEAEYNRRFGVAHWVRGHFFHFWDKTKWNKIYKLAEEDLKSRNLVLTQGVLRKWKKPFIRGQGKVKQSVYVVK